MLGTCCARWLSRPRVLDRHPAKWRRADRGLRAGEEVRRTELGDAARRRRRGRVPEAVPVLAGARRPAGVAVELATAQRARVKLAELRAAHALLADDGHALVADEHGLRLWTFAGGRANNLLGRALEAKLGPKIVIDNQYVAFREQAGLSDAAIRKALAELREEQRPNHDDALRFAKSCARSRTSKFQPCLSDRLESELLAEVLTNEDDARRALGTPEALGAPE